MTFESMERPSVHGAQVNHRHAEAISPKGRVMPADRWHWAADVHAIDGHMHGNADDRKAIVAHYEVEPTKRTGAPKLTPEAAIIAADLADALAEQEAIYAAAEAKAKAEMFEAAVNAEVARRIAVQPVASRK